jgi:hypothetical protein
MGSADLATPVGILINWRLNHEGNPPYLCRQPVRTTGATSGVDGISTDDADNVIDDDGTQVLQQYRDEITKLDLEDAAARLNVPFKKGMIVINSLGKDFMVDATGDLVSECHKNLWVHGPVLRYILNSRGINPKGDWVSFGELKGAGDWNRFFTHRCELDMHRLADAHTDIFFQILEMFGAGEIQSVTNSDKSLVIYPLPNVPFLINYWAAEESFDSKLSILFDTTAEENIDMESIYVLGRGLVEMFRVLIAKHSKDGKLF